MGEEPAKIDRLGGRWGRALLRPLAVNDARAGFWVQHVRVGVALSEVSAFVVMAYVVLADRPHRALALTIALIVIAASPLLLALPIERLATSPYGALLFYLWSVAVTLVILAAALLDGGTESPLTWLFVLTMTFGVLAYPPLGVVLVGTLMVTAYLTVAVVDSSVSSVTFVVVAVLSTFTVMTAWVSRNHWHTYEQQLLLTARLAELDRAREEFVATTSHEVRTPVASILGYVELLEESQPEPDQARFLAAIRRSADRLRDLSEDLLVLSRGESGGRAHDSGDRCLGEADLVEIARGVCETMAPLAARQQITLDLQLPSEPLTVTGSAEQLERAVLNLVSNAVKYTASGGRVACTLRRLGQEAVIRVDDTGIGIADDELQRLFTRFYRASSARDRSIAGVGLGLSIVQEIVHAHGGRIEVTSRLDHGTSFIAHLPCSQPSGHDESPRPPADPELVASG